MPRNKDAIFAQISCRILHGQRFNQLDLAARAVYLELWILAVRERSETLPGINYGMSFLAHELHSNLRFVKKQLTKIASLGLIDFLPDETITVHSVRDCHKRLDWKEVRQMDFSRTGLGTTDDRVLEIEIDIKTDPDTEIVTPPPPTPPNRPTPEAVFKNGSPPEPESEPVPPAIVRPQLSSDLERAQHNLLQKRSALGVKTSSPNTSPNPDLEREVQDWFLTLWPHGEYDWNLEKSSLLTQVQKHGRGAYNVARAILGEHKRAGKLIANELAYLNGIAREQARK